MNTLSLFFRILVQIRRACELKYSQSGGSPSRELWEPEVRAGKSGGASEGDGQGICWKQQLERLSRQRRSENTDTKLGQVCPELRQA